MSFFSGPADAVRRGLAWLGTRAGRAPRAAAALCLGAFCLIAWPFLSITGLDEPVADFLSRANGFSWTVWLSLFVLAAIAVSCTRMLGNAAVRKDRLLDDVMSRQDRLRDFIAVASDLFWETDREDRFVFVSDPSGRGEQEIAQGWIGLNWQNLASGREAKAAMADLLRALAARRSFRDFEILLHREDRSPCWLLVSGKPLYDDTGQFLGYRGLARDVTHARGERVRSNAARARLVRAIESGSEGVALFDSNDRLILCNARFRELLFPGNEGLVAAGADFGDLAGHFAKSGLDPEAAADPGVWTQRRLANRRKGIPGEHRAGGETWIRYHDQRTPEGDWICLLSDVTSLKSREVELSRLSSENRRLAAAVDNTEAGVVITDPRQEGNPIVFVNPAFTRMTGYAPEEVLGKSYHLLQGPNSDQETLERIEMAMARRVAVQADLYSYRKSGTTFWDRVVINPIMGGDDNPDYFVGIHQDVTRQKRFERELRVTKDAAEVANKSKSEFLANMSHELRTPLNAIIGFSDILNAEMFGALGSDRYRDYAQDIHDSGVHLLDLINDILDLSKAEAGKIELLDELVDLESAIARSLTMVRQRAEERGVSLVAEMPADLPHLIADERRLKQILLNLLSNAVKFTPRGGKVFLEARRESDGLALSVADEGIGIAPENIERVLQPFGQVDSALAREHEGTGLGLPLTKRLVELHNAEFSLESKLGAGTRITIRFPEDRLTVPAAA